MKMSDSGPDRSSNAFGAQSLSAGLSKNISASGGLGNTRATPVGRSTTDLGRVAGMLSRGRARPGQVQGALMMERANTNALAEEAINRIEQPTPATPLATAAGAMGVAETPATREGNIAAAKKAGTFDATRTSFNTQAAPFGQYMNEQGTIGAPPPPQNGASSAPRPMLGEGINPVVPEAPPVNAFAPKKTNRFNALSGAANQMGVLPAFPALY